MYQRIKKFLFMFLELLLRFTINPYLRAYLLKLFGANVGKNVRIYESQFFNLTNGFSNLVIGDNVHIGIGCKFDLHDVVLIGAGTTISPGVTILSHSDPGSFHNSPLCQHFPPLSASVKIGKNSWIGANSTLLAGSEVHDNTVIGACSLLNMKLEKSGVYYGVPAKFIRTINAT